ncbi:conserved hypothetical protein [Methylocella tundrae]|uniref:MlaB-like STAS domain-containing protein n=1 Tax=Methylocella tundrae TaxID=227605 RepID=A0A8B6M6H3_METTU|nr:STAS domain-containing protein [Methylocella tundrae]VTZ24957.1 conserved hypothetical protein [Methylocella tundrae]VTZ50450.1 conserved hypothetical protein [Methylocella tundrae]
MSKTQSASAHQARILALPAILDLKAATPLASELLARRGEELSADASAVQRLGGQCLQVLLSAIMTWRADELPFAVVNASPDFIEGLRRLGIAPHAFIDEELSQ